MKVLVTGANGLLATHLIKELTQSNVAVHGLLRDKQKFILPANENLTILEADVTNIHSLGKAMEGCSHVIHAAAMTNQNERDYKKYYAVNVAGTENVLRCAVEHNIKRFILVSTANTLGYGTSNKPGTEQQPMKVPFTKSLYARSKQEAEYIVQKYQNQLDIITVHPTFMLGAYDAGPSSGQLVTMAYNKRIIFYPPGGKNFIHVQDAAKAIIKVLHQGRSGQKYLLANEDLSYYDFFKKVGRISKKKTWLIPLPVWILWLLGYVGDMLRIIGINTALSSANLKILRINNYYSNEKIKRELTLEFQSTDQAIDDTVKWFKERSMC